jgi:hypothetical protein
MLYLNNTTLTSIVLGSNQIGDEGAEYLAKSILYNRSLTDIIGVVLSSVKCRNILDLDETFYKFH